MKNSKKKKKGLTAKSKKGLCISAAVVAVIAVIITLFTVFQTGIYTEFLYMIMPKSLEKEFDTGKVTFYVEKSDDFDQFKDKKTPLKAFEYYYYDEDGNRVDIEYNGVYKTGDETFSPYIWFSFNANARLNKAKSFIGNSLPFIIIGVIVVLIIISFFIWSKKEDEKKKKLYGDFKKKKKKN